MLAVSYSDYQTYGCPNCGCDTSIRGSFYRTDSVPFTCENCHVEFMVLADGLEKSSIGTYASKNSKEAEFPIRIEHPRKAVGPKWEYEWPDLKPEYGEYFASRGIGYDLAGFVKSRQAGERIVEMARQVLNLRHIRSWLDYRPDEPKWIQVKFQDDEFDLELLDKKTRENNDIITEEILRDCALRRYPDM